MTRGDLSFTCLLLKEARGYSALCPDLDVASQGSSPAKAKQMLREAIELHLETAFESNLPYLRPVPADQDPRNAAPDSVVETFTIRADLSVQVHA